MAITCLKFVSKTTEDVHLRTHDCNAGTLFSWKVHGCRRNGICWIFQEGDDSIHFQKRTVDRFCFASIAKRVDGQFACVDETRAVAASMWTNTNYLQQAGVFQWMAIYFLCKSKRNKIGFSVETWHYAISIMPIQKSWKRRLARQQEAPSGMRFLSDRSGAAGQLRFRNVSWSVAERYCPLARWCLCPMTRQKAWRPLRFREAARYDSDRIGRRTFRREQPWGAGRWHRHARPGPSRPASRSPGRWRA